MKPTLTIGIAAYNEAENIGNLLKSLLAQKIERASLQEIIVVSDASTDGTDAAVSLLRDSRVKCVRHNVRMGACRAQETVRAQTTSDILVFLDADTLPESPDCIDALILPLIANPSIGLVSMHLEPLSGETFIERALAESHRFKTRLFDSIDGGVNLYTCFGPARAFSRALYEKISFPDDLPIDALSYMLCRMQGMQFFPVHAPRILFRCPNTLADHLKQSARFVSGKQAIIRRFGKAAKDAYAIPKVKLLMHMVRELLLHPVLFWSFLAIASYAKRRQQKAFSSLWDIAVSSKKLI